MASKQIAIKEVLNLEIHDYSTGDLINFVDYASNTSIETTSERLDVRGGQGNFKLVSFDHSKDMMFMTQLPLVDLDYLSTLTGEDLKIDAFSLPKREVLTASSQTITLSETPVAASLKVYKLLNDRDVDTEQTVGTPATTENEYSISGSTITLNATTAPDGATFVVTYKYLGAATTRRVRFSGNKFAKYVTIYGHGIVLDEVTNEEFVTAFVIHKCKPQNNFTITQNATEATVLDITYDMFPITEIEDNETKKVYMDMYELV